VPADSLGVTLCHEHLRFRDETVAANWPSRYDDGAIFDAAVRMVEVAKVHGVRTIVDPSAMNAGRDVHFLGRVSDATAIQVIACTGVYTFEHLPFYFENRSVDVMADHFVEDLRDGMQGTPYRAAFIKGAADVQGMTPAVEKVHRAAARAALRTGAPIMAHSSPAADNGPKQLDLFEEEGVDLARVQICHYGDTTNVGRIEELLDRGAFVGLDRFGSPFPPYTPQRAATAAELLRRGHVERLIVSHDYCGYIDWFPQEVMDDLLQPRDGEVKGLGLVFEHVLPRLRAEGVLDEAAFDTIFVRNPRRWLTGG
jgi:phosphotriesterase-related protein